VKVKLIEIKSNKILNATIISKGNLIPVYLLLMMDGGLALVSTQKRKTFRPML